MAQELRIEKQIYGGDGLARLQNGDERALTVFAPYTIAGELVKVELGDVRKGFARARVLEVLEPSADRVAPRCEHFGRCGGCSYQHMNDAAQLATKTAILRETLERTAKIAPDSYTITAHAAEPWGFRNRARLQTQTLGGFRCGFLKANSHQLEPVRNCPLLAPELNRALEAMWSAGSLAPRSLEQTQWISNHDGSQLLVELYLANGGRGDELEAFCDALFTALPELVGAALFEGAGDEEKMRLPKPLGAFGESQITYKTALADFELGAGSFFQTNKHMVDVMQKLVVSDDETGAEALDLYAGVGFFSRPLSARYKHVTAVEISTFSSAALREAAPNNLSVRKQSVDEFLERTHHRAFDRVVCDPPRAGLGEKAAGLLSRLETSRITYVSCDPVTLARDLKILLQSGFRIEAAHLLDIFPQTSHLETIVHLTR